MRDRGGDRPERGWHHLDDLIPEYVPTGQEPGDDDQVAQAAFWCEVNCARWGAAVRREQASGLVCDDDPLKLHYGWSLVRLGVADPQRWHREVAANREAVARRRLGFADLVLVSLPALAELWRRREADTTRLRRNFERHVRLAKPLRDWYAALDRVCPGRVRWHLPGDGVPAPRPSARTDRYDLGLFDRFIAALPPVCCPTLALACTNARVRRKTLIVCPPCHDSIHDRQPANTLT